MVTGVLSSIHVVVPWRSVPEWYLAAKASQQPYTVVIWVYNIFQGVNWRLSHMASGYNLAPPEPLEIHDVNAAEKWKRFK